MLLKFWNLLQGLWNLFQGKKVYIVSIATLVYAGLGLYLKFLTVTDAMPLILGALGALGFRSALKKLE